MIDCGPPFAWKEVKTIVAKVNFVLIEPYMLTGCNQTCFIFNSVLVMSF